jgi:hypothetical protein
MAPSMGLLSVMANMAAHLQTVDVAQRQADDVTRWTMRIEAALTAAAAVEGASAGFDAYFYGSDSHRTWLLTSHSVIAALKAQEAQAERIYHEAKQAAAAAAARAEAAEARAAGAKEGSGAEAAAMAEAAEARAAQAAAEARAAAAAAWQEAAADARAFGESFVAREDNIHRPVGEAVARVGGPLEVARKHYNQGG